MQLKEICITVLEKCGDSVYEARGRYLIAEETISEVRDPRRSYGAGSWPGTASYSTTQIPDKAEKERLMSNRCFKINCSATYIEIQRVNPM
jgi:hypothetical protein